MKSELDRFLSGAPLTELDEYKLRAEVFRAVRTAGGLMNALREIAERFDDEAEALFHRPYKHEVTKGIAMGKAAGLRTAAQACGHLFNWGQKRGQANG